MTVSYSRKISHAGFYSFTRLLVYWRGSIYKLIWPELFIYLGIYYGLELLYQFALVEHQKEKFENVCNYAKQGMTVIPLSFLLGFYVSLVVGRWWNMYNALTWIDEFALVVSSQVHGTDRTSRMTRRTLVRWFNLMTVIVYRTVSLPVLERFPTIQHLQKAGLLTEEELQTFEAVSLPHTKFWLPCLWACNLITTLRDEKVITKDLSHRYLIERFQAHRKNCQDLMSYDWVSIPLVYTQVVTIACYTYFLSSVFARQFQDPDPEKGHESYEVDLYFPILATLEFFFYFGWLKVAQAIINPYGGDDDDFELNYIIDRNVQVGYTMVDECYSQTPTLEMDKHWDDKCAELPYTKSTMHYKKRRAWTGSAVAAKVSPDDYIDGNIQRVPEDMCANNDLPRVNGQDGQAYMRVNHEGENIPLSGAAPIPAPIASMASV